MDTLAEALTKVGFAMHISPMTEITVSMFTFGGRGILRLQGWVSTDQRLRKRC